MKEPNREVPGYETPSARQILWDAGVPEDIIDGALHVHAHELAEKIRNHEWSECGFGDTNCPCDGADLIDPEGT